MNIEQLLKEKRQDILLVADKYGAHNIRVFGSVARGEADEKSDLDLLVEFKPKVRLFDWLHMEMDLEKLLGVSVDIVEEKALKGKMVQRVLKDAVPL
jgi:predicted nucleotidyltransferase